MHQIKTAAHYIPCKHRQISHLYTVNGVGYNGLIKEENILKGRLDSIPSLTPSVKIQIMGGKVCLRCKGKTF